VDIGDDSFIRVRALVRVPFLGGDGTVLGGDGASSGRGYFLGLPLPLFLIGTTAVISFAFEGVFTFVLMSVLLLELESRA
jgi:hypothetical protein